MQVKGTYLSYCFNCSENTEIMNPKLSNIRTLLSKCFVCGNKESKFIKEQEASRLLNKLDIKIPLSKIPLLGDILFC